MQCAKTLARNRREQMVILDTQTRQTLPQTQIIFTFLLDRKIGISLNFTFGNNLPTFVLQAHINYPHEIQVPKSYKYDIYVAKIKIIKSNIFDRCSYDLYIPEDIALVLLIHQTANISQIIHYIQDFRYPSWCSRNRYLVARSNSFCPFNFIVPVT